MLRLPPTVIGLSRSDIEDYDERRELGRRKKKRVFARELDDIILTTVPRTFSPLAYRPFQKNPNDLIALQPSCSNKGTTVNDFDALNSSHDVINLNIGDLDKLSHNYEFSSIPPRSTSIKNLQTCYPTEDQFYYAGLLENSLQEHPQGTSSKSAPNFRINLHLNKSHTNFPLNIGFSSQKQTVTSGCISRKVFRDTYHNPPGLSYPQITKKVFRHQDNSYSLDSLECPNAVKHDRASSSSTNYLSSPEIITSSHTALHRDSLQSSRVSVGAAVAIQNSPQRDQKPRRDSTLSISRPPLPPPFSIIPRKVSTADSMPGIFLPIHSEGALIPIKNEEDVDGAEQDQNNSEALFAPAYDPQIRIPSSSSYSQPQRSLDNFETHGQNQPILVSNTPTRNYQVYNDGIPPELQPQTPANLPESRHRSRYYPSFTAPRLPNHRRHLNGFNDIIETANQNQLSSTVGQLSNERNTSSISWRTNGFDSLYGGRENGDEERNWAQGLRYNNTWTRLWRSGNSHSEESTL